VRRELRSSAILLRLTLSLAIAQSVALSNAQHAVPTGVHGARHGSMMACAGKQGRNVGCRPQLGADGAAGAGLTWQAMPGARDGTCSMQS